MASRLKFVTYNIRKGKGASGKLRTGVSDLGRALSAFRPDVVLCQEVFHGYDPEVSQSNELASLLALNPYYEPNKQRRIGHHGNATFTKHPVLQVHNYDVSTNPIERRGVLYARLLLGDRPVHVLNVHLGLNQGQRLAQITRVQTILGERCGSKDPVILAGDFNDWNGRVDKVVQGELGMVNAFAHLPQRLVNTWHARRPVFNLDRVYTKNLEVAYAQRLHGDPWQELSDHLPLWVELEVG